MYPVWQPIETCPDGVTVIVGWVDEDGAELIEFDVKEDGIWLNHADDYEHCESVAPPGSKKLTPEAPYQFWFHIPLPIPGKVPGCEDCAYNGRFLCDTHGPKRDNAPHSGHC